VELPVVARGFVAGIGVVAGVAVDVGADAGTGIIGVEVARLPGIAGIGVVDVNTLFGIDAGARDSQRLAGSTRSLA